MSFFDFVDEGEKENFQIHLPNLWANLTRRHASGL